MASCKKVGTLSRSNQLTLDPTSPAVFNLENWSIKARSSCVKQAQVDLSILEDQRAIAIVKFFFSRWLCWANVIEILLVILLSSCCFLQCYDVIADYFNYPTYVSVSKVMNEDFRQDLPSVTICNGNQVAKTALRYNYPQYNLSHFVAISQKTFYSLENFTYDLESKLDMESQIDWLSVKRFLTNYKMEDAFKLSDNGTLLKSITCTSSEGDQLPCSALRQVESLQDGINCRTLFHDSILWDSRFVEVRELEQALEHLSDKPSEDDEAPDPTGMSYTYSAPALDLDSLPAPQLSDALSESKLELGNDEIVRIRLDFRPSNYADRQSSVSASLSVHSNSVLGFMRHIVFKVRPGFWYNYYINRFDFKRLPAPYASGCFNYEFNRAVWLDREQWLAHERRHLTWLAQRVVALASAAPASGPSKRARADEPAWFEEDHARIYADTLRNRSLSLVSRSSFACAHGPGLKGGGGGGGSGLQVLRDSHSGAASYLTRPSDGASSRHDFHRGANQSAARSGCTSELV